MAIKRGIILADLQFPNHNPVLLDNVERYMRTRKWDFCVILGDFFDMDAISHHAYESGNIRAIEGKRLKKDYQEGERILRRWRKIVGEKCKMYFFMGNHEEWGDEFVDKYPGLEGLIEVKANMPFKELNIEVVEPRNFIKIGKIVFVHGDVVGGKYQSVHHAKKALDIYSRNIVYGDKHTLQVHTKLSPAGIDETHTAYSIPCLANTNPAWAENRPNSWLNGFGVFELSDTSGQFTIHPVVSVKNGFVMDGNEYS